MFAILGLHHWTKETKMILMMFTVLGPILFIFIGSCVLSIIWTYNTACEIFYNRKLDTLETYEKSVLNQIAALEKK